MSSRQSSEDIASAQATAEARVRSSEVDRQHKDGTLAGRGTSREELNQMIEAERASRKT